MREKQLHAQMRNYASGSKKLHQTSRAVSNPQTSPNHNIYSCPSETSDSVRLKILPGIISDKPKLFFLIQTKPHCPTRLLYESAASYRFRSASDFPGARPWPVPEETVP